MPGQTPPPLIAAAPEPSKRPTAAVIGLVFALLGLVLLAFSFVNGISQALNGSSDGAGGFVALFLLGLAIELIALASAIFRLIARRWRVLSILTIAVAAVPIGVLIYLYTSN